MRRNAIKVSNNANDDYNNNNNYVLHHCGKVNGEDVDIVAPSSLVE